MLRLLIGRSHDLEESGLSYLLSRRARRRVSHRAREDAHRSDRGDDAALRSMSRSAPCGRKESGDDGRGIGCSNRCHRRGGRGSAAVVESTDQSEAQGVTPEAPMTTWVM